MIFGNINNLSEFPFLEEQVKECFEYAKTHDLASYEKGSHEIDGDRLFVNIVEYTTTTPEERFWEAHKNYLDVHVMIHGNEQIDLNFIQNMELKDFVEKDDFLPMDGEKNSSVVLTDGDFLICYPSDGHRTAVQVQEPEAIKKAIFKVNVSGGNIDVTILSRVINRGLMKGGRTTEMLVEMADRPGSLLGLCQVICRLGANIISIHHERNGESPDVNSCNLRMVLETRDQKHIDELHQAIEHAGYSILN